MGEEKRKVVAGGKLQPGHRRIARQLDGSRGWNKGYKGDVKKPGQHLPNRAMALRTMLRDLLIMRDKKVDSLIPGDVKFAQYLAPEFA